MTSPIQGSDTLTNQTWQALESHGLDIPGPATGQVSFKKVDGGYGLTSIDELLKGRFVITRRGTDIVEFFETPDAVIGAGWVLD